MNLSINANGFSNVQNTAAGHKAEQANKQGKSAFFAGSPVLTTKNQIEQRKKMAQKSALKLVKDAWDNDQAVEKTVASQRQRYAELDAQRTEAKKALAGYEDQAAFKNFVLDVGLLGAMSNLKAKSLRQFVADNQSKKTYRISMNDYQQEDWVTNLPLYAVNGLDF